MTLANYSSQIFCHRTMLASLIGFWTPCSPTALHRGRPRPYRAYYGEADVDVPPEDSVTFVKRAQALGGNATAVPVGAVDHFGSLRLAAPKIRQWFDKISDTEAATN